MQAGEPERIGVASLGQLEGDDVAATEPLAREPARGLAGERAQPGEALDAAGEHQGRRIRPLVGNAIESLPEMARRRISSTRPRHG